MTSGAFRTDKCFRGFCIGLRVELCSTGWLSPSGFYRNLLYETLNRGSACTQKVRILWCLWLQGSSFTQKSDNVEKIRGTLLWMEKRYMDNKDLYYLYLCVILQFILCFIEVSCPWRIVLPSVCMPRLLTDEH